MTTQQASEYFLAQASEKDWDTATQARRPRCPTPRSSATTPPR